jgi:hypothetical protein
MRTTHFATVLAIVASLIAASAFARDDGPRFANDRLDALVAQHAEANRHIASKAPRPEPRPDALEAKSH